MLICPVCGAELTLTRRPDGKPGALSCADGHRFDAAKQGYLNLLTGRPSKHLEDTKDMVASRERWLDGGHYAPIADALAGAARHLLQPPSSGIGPTPVRIVDTGSGTGYYTRHVLDAMQRPATAVDLDLSRAGAQRAARDPRVLSLVWDTWKDWPLAADSADLLLDVFAPRNLHEFARVLRPGGVALVAVPLPAHLQQLRSAGLLGMDEHKEERLAEAFGTDFAEVHSVDVQRRLPVSVEQATDLIHMGPAGHHSAWHVIHDSLAQNPVHEVTIAVRIHCYRRL
jgi:23S rRNA (guanine745-N1)-methyltransferase